MDELIIQWTEYVRYRAGLRGFDLWKAEHILRYSNERYVDMSTGRFVAVGRHDRRLLMIPYDRERNVITPVTIHATTRKQVNFRLKSGRFKNE